jgi:hypothetical protein
VGAGSVGARGFRIHLTPRVVVARVCALVEDKIQGSGCHYLKTGLPNLQDVIFNDKPS